MALQPDVIDWLRMEAARSRRFGSVCSGAFLLGQAGLISGKRVTAHWAVADALSRRFPDAIVEPDAISIFDGPLRTAAGVTAGLDLALALVEEDLGAEIARAVAAQLVIFFRRGEVVAPKRPASRKIKASNRGCPPRPRPRLALSTAAAERQGRSLQVDNVSNAR